MRGLGGVSYPCLFHDGIRFFFTAPASTEIYTLSLHDALPICGEPDMRMRAYVDALTAAELRRPEMVEENERRSEEHTSELQSPCNLVCRLLLEKKKITTTTGLRHEHPPENEDFCDNTN